MTLDEFRIEPEVSEGYWEGLATGALRCCSHRGGPVWGKARRRQRLSRSTKVQTAGTAHSGTPGRYHGHRCRARWVAPEQDSDLLAVFLSGAQECLTEDELRLLFGG